MNSTSLAVKGWPSLHFTPRLSVIFQTSPSGEMRPFSRDGTSTARLGMNWPWSSMSQSASNMQASGTFSVPLLT